MTTVLPFNVISILFMAILSIIGFTYCIKYSMLILTIGIILTIFNLHTWIINLSHEYTTNSQFYKSDKNPFIKGFLIFIVTEIVFFSSFFWAYYNFLLDPNTYIGGAWPPMYNILCKDIPLHIDILLGDMNISLICVTIIIIISNQYINSIFIKFWSTLIIVCMGFFFILKHSKDLFDINSTKIDLSDGIFSSSLHVITGLHSIHVLVGVYIIYMIYLETFRIVHLDTFGSVIHKNNNKSEVFYKSKWLIASAYLFVKNNVFTMSSFYYWHLIDVIWILVFITQYIHYTQLDTIIFHNICIIDNIF